MERKITEYGQEITLTDKDVESAVMQFICTCHPEMARTAFFFSSNTFSPSSDGVARKNVGSGLGERMWGQALNVDKKECGVRP